MLKRLYARTLEIAAGPNALAALLVVSFVESSVFPIPPDILLIPMILARPRGARVHRAAADAGHDAVRGGAHWRLCGAALSIAHDPDDPVVRPPGAGGEWHRTRGGAVVAVLGRAQALRIVPAAALAMGCGD